MLRVCIATLLLLGYHVHGAPTTNDGNKILTFSDRIAKVFGAKCLKNAGQLEYKELLDELNHVKQCSIFTFKPPLLGEELSARCELHGENMTQCLTKFVENLEHCLDPKEKYLMQFIMDIYNTSAKDFCDYTQKLSVTASLHQATAKCVTKYKEIPELNPHLVCYKNSTLIGDNAPKSIFTKEELCSDIEKTELCFAKLLDEHCPDAPEVKEYQRHFTKAAMKHCSDVLTQSSEETSEDPIKSSQEME